MKIIKISQDTIVFIENIKEINKEVVPKNILEYLKRCHNQRKYKESINAWYSLYQVLKEYYLINLAVEEIKLTKDNKPFIDKINFNLSHSHHLVVGIVSFKECGIDIEMIDYKKDLEALKTLLFNDDADIDTFYQKWVKTEAHLKRVGTGIKSKKDFKNKSLNNQVFECLDEEGNKYYYSYDIL